MYRKVLASVAAASLLAAGICGCGSQESASTASSAQSASVSKSSEASGTGTQDSLNASEAETVGDEAYNITWDDVENIQVYYCSMGPAGTGVSAVADEINKITEPYNIHVNLTQLDIGSYEQQVSLMMSSSEPVDLLITLPGGPCSFSSMSAQGQLMDITALMDEYAPQTLSGIGDYMKGTMVGDTIYGVTCYQNL